MGRYWKSIGIIFLLCSFCFASMSITDTVYARKHFKGDTATIKIKTDSASVSDSILVQQGGLIMRRSKAQMRLDLGKPVVKQGYGITVTTQEPDTYTVALYTPPVIASLTNSTLTNYAGQTVTGTTVSWTLTGAAITEQTLTDCTPDPSDRSHVFTGLSLTTDKYYTLAITDGVTPSSASTYVRFYIQKYYDTTSSATPNAANVQAGTSIWTLQYAGYQALSATNIAEAENTSTTPAQLALELWLFTSTGFYLSGIELR